MVQFRDWNYAINALSWFVILQSIGLNLERTRAGRLAALGRQPIPAEPMREGALNRHSPQVSPIEA